MSQGSKHKTRVPGPGWSPSLVQGREAEPRDQEDEGGGWSKRGWRDPQGGPRNRCRPCACSGPVGRVPTASPRCSIRRFRRGLLTGAGGGHGKRACSSSPRSYGLVGEMRHETKRAVRDPRVESYRESPGRVPSDVVTTQVAAATPEVFESLFNK